MCIFVSIGRGASAGARQTRPPLLFSGRKWKPCFDQPQTSRRLAAEKSVLMHYRGGCGSNNPEPSARCKHRRFMLDNWGVDSSWSPLRSLTSCVLTFFAFRVSCSRRPSFPPPLINISKCFPKRSLKNSQVSRRPAGPDLLGKSVEQKCWKVVWRAMLCAKFRATYVQSVLL